MAIVKNLIIDQNSTFATEVTLYTKSKLFFDLTGYTATAQIRKAPTSLNPAATFTIAVPQPITGKLILQLTDEQTAAIKPGRYIYDIVVENSLGQKYRALEGIVTITAAATR